jgi:hypothetical protein
MMSPRRQGLPNRDRKHSVVYGPSGTGTGTGTGTLTGES